MHPHGPRTTKDLRRFGLAFGTAFTLLGSLLLWKERAAGPYVLGIAVTVLLAGILRPRVLAPLERVLAGVLRVVMTVVTHVVLVIAFFLVLLPVGLLLRVLRKDLLGMKPAPEAATFWEPVDPEGPTSRPDKPY